MNTISADVVEKTWKRMATGEVADAQKLAAQMSREQPFVQAYLLAVGERDLNPDEAPLLLYIGTVVWQMFVHGGRRVAMVKGDALDRAEKANMKMLEYLEGEPETDFTKVVESLASNYNQVEVLRYVASALMEEPEEGCDIREESLGQTFIHLKTVVDCLDQDRKTIEDSHPI
ncbi:MAG: hypothetical protein NTX53_21875 [candidate division WOR-3 bacterium]|nr:hypothetical protein [candidate division WOR-3 bacterium]